MNRYYSIILFLICQSFVLTSSAQQKLALEQIQVYSTINPIAKYWQLPKDLNPIISALDSGFFLKLDLKRDTQIIPKTLYLNKLNQLGKININWSETRDYDLHAYLELYEMDPDFIYRNNLAQIPAAKRDSIHSIWLVTISLFNKQQNKVIQKTIILGLSPINSIGIGYLNKASASTPYHIYNAITKSISMLAPEREDIEYMDAKLPAAYTIDNYWMPYVHNQPRILFDTTKKFINYNTSNGPHLLRMPSAILNKINVKDKSINNPYKNVISLIKKNRINAFNSEYYQVIQSLRDVKNDYDYTVEGYLEFNVEGTGLNNQLALVFLPDSIHKIYNNKDSIGCFIVKDIVPEINKYFYSEIIYNGYDSTKQYTLSDKKNEKHLILHNKSIDGKINNNTFSIKLSADNTIKTLFLNNNLIAILTGKEKPEQMVLVDKTAPEQLTDFLIMFSFSEIFQNPN
ncbi:MAG: hypothetical protein RLZ95_118 [Bacteroidota bacterium]|jgi:hypothetical protein